MVRRSTMLAVLAFAAIACTSSGPSGTFSEIAIDTAATSSPEQPLVGGGTSFGMCAGYCRREIVIRRDGRVILDLSAWGERPRPIRNRGRLALDALAEARALAAHLDGVPLEETYGCPDCTDGGAAWVSLWDRREPVSSTYEFGEPPPELADVDRLLAGLMDALETCVSTDAVRVETGCTPRPSY